MSLIVKWRSIQYLKSDDFSAQPEVYRNLYETLDGGGILDKLKIYMPTLVAPYAVGLAAEGDTVRLLCEVYSFETFHAQCDALFGDRHRFQIVEKVIDEKPAICVRFKQDNFHFEIIGQPLPIEDQSLFLLTAIYDRLLKLTPAPLVTKATLLEQRSAKAMTTAENTADSADQTADETPKFSLAASICNLFGVKYGDNRKPETALLGLLDLDDVNLRQQITTTL